MTSDNEDAVPPPSPRTGSRGKFHARCAAQRCAAQRCRRFRVRLPASRAPASPNPHARPDLRRRRPRRHGPQALAPRRVLQQRLRQGRSRGLRRAPSAWACPSTPAKARARPPPRPRSAPLTRGAASPPCPVASDREDLRGNSSRPRGAERRHHPGGTGRRATATATRPPADPRRRRQLRRTVGEPRVATGDARRLDHPHW